MIKLIVITLLDREYLNNIITRNSYSILVDTLEDIIILDLL